MSFEWENGYKTHECRSILAYCVYRQKEMGIMISILRYAGYTCGEEEVREYLKLYPISERELLYEEDTAIKIEETMKRPVIKNRDKMFTEKKPILKKAQLEKSTDEEVDEIFNRLVTPNLKKTFKIKMILISGPCQTQKKPHSKSQAVLKSFYKKQPEVSE